ncbi:MAG: hypothetical protein M1826_007302 [Phylliscum demangeonii]|nr:MAG: hypothetical protein M1826_007302 [Phylliscum demangeonii]
MISLQGGEYAVQVEELARELHQERAKLRAATARLTELEVTAQGVDGRQQTNMWLGGESHRLVRKNVAVCDEVAENRAHLLDSSDER